MKQLNNSAGTYVLVQSNVFLGRTIRMLFENKEDALLALQLSCHYLDSTVNMKLWSFESPRVFSVKEILRYELKTVVHAKSSTDISDIDYLVYN